MFVLSLNVFVFLCRTSTGHFSVSKTASHSKTGCVQMPDVRVLCTEVRYITVPCICYLKSTRHSSSGSTGGSSSGGCRVKTGVSEDSEHSRMPTFLPLSPQSDLILIYYSNGHCLIVNHHHHLTEEDHHHRNW